MKKQIIIKALCIYSIVGVFTLISCKKEEQAPNNSTYDFSIDKCGVNLLKGTYVSKLNQNDTIIIDSNIRTYVRGAKPNSTNYIDIYKYCASKDTITLDRWGWTKPLTPTVKVKYTYVSNVITFSKMDFGSYNGIADSFFESINNKSFIKVN